MKTITITIIINEGNIKENQYELSRASPMSKWPLPKTNAGKDVEKEELCIVAGNVN